MNARELPIDVRETLANIIANELLRSGDSVDYDDNLLAEGMVDSLGMLRLVGYIEDIYGYKVPPTDFVIENFRTLNQLNQYLSDKLVNAEDS